MKLPSILQPLWHDTFFNELNGVYLSDKDVFEEEYLAINDEE